MYMARKLRVKTKHGASVRGSVANCSVDGAVNAVVMKSHKRKHVRLSDPLIVPRVRKYLTENVDKTFIDVKLMARTLRNQYHEYGKINQNAFHKTVEAAYHVVLKSYGLADNRLQSSDSSSDSDDSDDLEVLEDGPSNSLNDNLATIYQKKKRNSDEIDKSSELIDISSDDDSDELPEKQPRLEEPPPDTDPSPSGASDEVKPPEVTEERERKWKIIKKLKPVAKPTNPQLKHSSKVTFDDVGGIHNLIPEICDLVMHMRHPEVYSKLGVKAPRGALLHGPPGSGKTLLANAIAGQLQLPIISTVATELVGGMSGESEKLIREKFDTASSIAPCILFIDEIDAVCGNRINAQKDMERRMVAQLLSSIDNLEENGAQVLLLAATNNPDALDPGLRRAGRLEQEIPLGIPTLDARKDILKILCRNLNLDDGVDLDIIAQNTPGYVGADLQALVNKSCTYAVKRIFEDVKESAKPVEEVSTEVTISTENGDVSNLNGTKDSGQNDTTDSNEIVDVVNETPEELPPVKIDSRYGDLMRYLNDQPFSAEQLTGMKVVQDDFLKAAKTIRPCAIREGFATVPDTTWDDVGSLADVRRDLQLAVLAPVKYPEQLKTLGLTVPSGVLLCGPPGCGKTLLAKAVANEAGINFISVKGPELLNMYVGESERAVRTCFSRAKNSAPCVIFFDEFDSLCPKRINADTSGATRVVNQLLTEMDGVEGREGVFVLAASNRPDIIDPAVLRPGRLDRILFVGMPLLSDRIEILQAITKKGTKPQLGPDVDLDKIAAATEGYTGADLAGLVRQAATQALTDFITGNLTAEQLMVNASHFETAISKTKTSVSSKEMQHYEKLRLKYAATGDQKCDVEMDTSECMDTV